MTCSSSCPTRAGLIARRADEVLTAACQRADAALYEAKDSGRDGVVGVA